RVREAQVFSLILPFDASIESIKKLEPWGIILSGGPASVHAPGAPMPDPAIFELGVPILGICYGAQIFAEMLGGKVERAAQREYGIAHLQSVAANSFLEGFSGGEQV